MPREKKQPEMDELLDEMYKHPFESRVEALNKLQANVTNEANYLKQKGEEANKVLQSINGNGK